MKSCDRVRKKMMTEGGQSMLGNTDDDGGQYDRVRDEVCADDRGLLDKVSGNRNNTNLLRTETGHPAQFLCLCAGM